MWHASVASKTVSLEKLEKIALAMLKGVGDQSLGEWRQQRPASSNEGRLSMVHIRRRLSKAEQRMVGEAEDRRSTPYHNQRAQIVSNITGIPAQTLLNMG